jgi:ABC-2 type transport system ATP-binding protein
MMTSPAIAQDGGEPKPVLQIENVVKTFGSKRALDGVSLELRRGGCLGLLGPNGAGKTTLVRSIVGRVTVDSGAIDILGAKAGSAQAKANIGWVPQELALYPSLTAKENLETFGTYSGLNGRELREAVEWCLNWSSLKDRANDQARTFSGGMKRRLNMAAGLVHRAPIVLLDEPTVGVDPQSRERIYEMIEHLRDSGTSIIYTSHYMEEVERLCDRVAIIDVGRIIAGGSPTELLREHFGTGAELSVRLKDASAVPVTAWIEQFKGERANGEVRFFIGNAVQEVPDLLRSAVATGVTVQDFTLRTPNLQALFLKLTGKDLRE